MLSPPPTLNHSLEPEAKDDIKDPPVNKIVKQKRKAEKVQVSITIQCFMYYIYSLLSMHFLQVEFPKKLFQFI